MTLGNQPHGATVLFLQGEPTNAQQISQKVHNRAASGVSNLQWKKIVYFPLNTVPISFRAQCYFFRVSQLTHNKLAKRYIITRLQGCPTYSEKIVYFPLNTVPIFFRAQCYFFRVSQLTHNKLAQKVHNHAASGVSNLQWKKILCFPLNTVPISFLSISLQLPLFLLLVTVYFLPLSFSASDSVLI